MYGLYELNSRFHIIHVINSNNNNDICTVPSCRDYGVALRKSSHLLIDISNIHSHAHLKSLLA